MDSRTPDPGEVPAEESPPGPADEATAGHGRTRRIVFGAGLSVAAAVASIAIAIPLGASGSQNASRGPSPAASEPAAPGSGGGAAAPGAPAANGGSTPSTAPAPGDGEAQAESVPEGPAPAKGVGRDPLTPDEVETALRLAVDPALRQNARTVTGAPGPEPLTVDLSEPLPNETDPEKSPRRADVYFYNYADNTLVKRVVNLNAGVLERSAQAPNMQPAPSRPETAAALKLLVDSPAGVALKAQYKAATGKDFTGVDELDANGSSYIAGPGDTTTAKCGAERCLILFVKVRGGVYLDTTRTVVNLSARTVTPPA
ncbi:Tat pathway signal sequence domain protein [Streptodolium elevatio]|uniref:Tat pathway signal sequence domain protein n=1 Tax=Streptodolium elevatio TaxID=3157996 RepID=A0ABV3DFJ3_9ACTN